MLRFKSLIIDYKKDMRERDEDSMQKKAETLREELKNRFNIEPFVNYKKGCHGPLVTIEFEAQNKDIKKIFKTIKREGPYTIDVEWKEDF